jgi:hypothetical protein
MAFQRVFQRRSAIYNRINAAMRPVGLCAMCVEPSFILVMRASGSASGDRAADENFGEIYVGALER